MPEDAEDTLPPEQPTRPVGNEAKEECSADELTAKDRQIEELTDTLKRSQAEFENYKKRMEREWSDRVKLAAERIILDLLTVLDTLDKAEEAVKKDKRGGVHADGIRSIHKQLWQILQKAGLREVDTSVPFEVFQKGYMMGTKVIRTAKVKVSVRSEPDEGISSHNHDQHEGDEE
jgi:molecular chaperone GrpE